MVWKIIVEFLALLSAAVLFSVLTGGSAEEAALKSFGIFMDEAAGRGRWSVSSSQYSYGPLHSPGELKVEKLRMERPEPARGGRESFLITVEIDKASLRGPLPPARARKIVTRAREGRPEEAGLYEEVLLRNVSVTATGARGKKGPVFSQMK